MKPNSTWYANLQRIRILMMPVISGHDKHKKSDLKVNLRRKRAKVFFQK